MGESTGHPAWAMRGPGRGSVQVDAPSGRLLRISSSLCQLLGCAERELLEKKLLDLALPEDRAGAQAAWRSLLDADAEELTFEMRCRCKDGGVRSLQMTGVFVRDARGRPYRAVVFVEDVTDRRRAEERALAAEQALAEGEARLRKLFYSNMAPMAFWMPDGRIVEANDAYLRLVGHPREDLAAGLVRWDPDLPPEERPADDRARAELLASGWTFTPFERTHERPDGTQIKMLVSGCLLPRVERCIRAGEPFEEELCYLGADGTVHPILNWGVPIRDERGEITSWVGLCLDIGRLKRTEEALRESERRLRAALDDARRVIAERERLEDELRRRERQLTSLMASSPDVIFRLDPEMRCTFVTASIEAMTGLPPEHFLGKHGSETWLPREMCEASDAACGEAARTGKQQRIEFSLGERRCRTRFIPELGPDGAVESFMGITEDVTAAWQAEGERQKLLESERAARDEAERVSRVKDDFVATLSHELRSPINAILGWARILRSRAPEPQALARGLEVIENNARLQADMVSELLDMSRIVSGKLRLDVQPVDLQGVLQSALEAIKLAAEAKGIAIHASVDPEASSLRGDPARIHQVAWNLLSNAVKFTPAGGRIDVALRRAGAHAELSVTDTGPGIAPQFLPHLFERFRQADASSTRKHGGLGIGLSIVKHLVELHGGAVGVASPGEGRGATFTVRLPLAGVSQRAPGAAQRPTSARAEALADYPAADLTGVRVLVVDDQPDAREVAQRVLEDCAASVTTAGSAAEAMATLERERPDVLVSDLGMPGEDGFQLIRRMRGLGAARGGATPAIALSALARAEDRARALGAGYQAHVAKPLDPAELVGVVASLVRERAAS
ncbi:hybrid sensor histidine kinase/response regulator [Sorangium sp. So ce362]|uniref:hybrid sensor histidine kinase/response regulator n=1 Tax=Sorangium sp. So ce362 TaxID=3133303 RepID=UPI003F617FDD